MIGGKCVVLNETIDYTFNRPDISFSNPTDFKNFYANKFVTITTDEGKEKKIPFGKYWFEHPKRRQYQGIVFSPSSETPGYFNLFSGFAVEPKEGDCSLYLDHLYQNISSGNIENYNYLIAWMADCVQNPADRKGTSIVLRGKQGTGKGVAISEFAKIFGHHFVHVQHTRHLVGNFNAHLKDVLLVFADEAFWAGDKSAEGVLKAMVTEEYMQIEPKGKDSFRIKNHIHLMISSNNDWVVPAGLEERRFFVLDVGEEHIRDHEYFNNIIEQMKNGGREALLYYLQNYDLSGINLRSFPMTAALYEMKLHSMTPIQKFWLAKLEAGSQLNDDDVWKNTPIPVEKFKQEYYEYVGNAGAKYKGTETELGIGLKNLCPSIKKVRPRGRDGKQYQAYIFPPLDECRKLWEKSTRCENEWPASGTSLRVYSNDFIDDGTNE